jgi:hypothetical protein
VAAALWLTDRLGYTAARDASGAVVARKRAKDPVDFPVPLLRAGDGDATRADVLAGVLRQVLTLQALRAPGPLETTRTAAFCGVEPDAVAPLLARVQALIGNPAGVGADEAGPIARIAGVIAAERTLLGDHATATRAATVEHAARRVGLEGSRRIAVLAYADELISDPALLDAYGTTFGAGDDVTLVIVTDDVAPLLDAVTAAGLEGDGSPDLLAVDAAPSGVDAVLSRRDDAAATVPRFDDRTLPSLRELVGISALRRS